MSNYKMIPKLDMSQLNRKFAVPTEGQRVELDRSMNDAPIEDQSGSLMLGAIGGMAGKVAMKGMGNAARMYHMNKATNISRSIDDTVLNPKVNQMLMDRFAKTGKFAFKDKAAVMDKLRDKGYQQMADNGASMIDSATRLNRIQNPVVNGSRAVGTAQ